MANHTINEIGQFEALKSPSPVNGAQDLHTNLLCIGDSAFLGYQIKMN